MSNYIPSQNERDQRKRFGKVLASERDKKGWTQSQLAEQLGYGVQTISNWETGMYFPKKTEDLLRLADIFACDVDYLLDRMQERTHDIKATCELTGLSESAAEWIVNLESSRKASFDRFIQHSEFEKMMDSYSLFLKMLDNASKRFVPGTPGANIGVGMDEEISIEKDGSVIVSSLWQILSLIGHDIGFDAQLITDVDRMTLWENDN